MEQLGIDLREQDQISPLHIIVQHLEIVPSKQVCKEDPKLTPRKAGHMIQSDLLL